jgi:hypothetical protein
MFFPKKNILILVEEKQNLIQSFRHIVKFWKKERALRLIYENFNSDYDTLLLKSGLPSLKIRRLRMMAIEIFKILHKQSPAYLNDIVSFKHISYF